MIDTRLLHRIIEGTTPNRWKSDYVAEYVIGGQCFQVKWCSGNEECRDAHIVEIRTPFGTAVYGR